MKNLIASLAIILYTLGANAEGLLTMSIDDGTLGTGGRGSSFSYIGAYDGEGHTIKVVVPSALQNDYVIGYSTNSVGLYSEELLFTNVCDQVVWYTVAAPGYNTYTNSAYVTITQASIVDEPGTAEIHADGYSKFDASFSYDGEEHTIKTSELSDAFATMLGSTEETTFQYATEEMKTEGCWTSVPPGYTNVGKHVFWYKIEDQNYETFEHQVMVEIKTRPVVFDALGPWMEDGATCVTQLVDETYEDLPVATRSGYKFLGWFDSVTNDAAQAVDCSNVRVSTSLYAKWQKLFGISEVDTNSIYIVGYTRGLTSSGISKLVLPDSIDGKRVVGIGRSAFRQCKFTSVEIPNSVTNIEDAAFWGCSFLREVVIGSRVTHIGSSAFSGCANFMDFVVDSENETYCAIDGVLFSKDKTRLIIFPSGRRSNYEIPDSVTDIERSAFSESCLSSVTIPDGITSIAEGAFSFCSIESLEIPASVTNIGASAFYGCSLLTSVAIPNGVTHIGKNAFYGCKRLESVAIGSGVTSIASGAFSECGKIQKFEVDSENEAYCAVDGVLLTKDGTELIAFPFGDESRCEIPQGVTNIGDEAFYGKKLTSIVIPNSVTNIGRAAFALCPRLESVSIPSSVTSIGERAFYSCTKLASIVVADGVTSIGEDAFAFCSDLESVTLPNSVTNIESGAFFECAAIKFLSVPQVALDKGMAVAFPKATALTQVDFCAGVTNIARGAFYNYADLTSVWIPDSVTSIAYNAFQKCGSLQRFEVDSENETYCAVDGVLFSKDMTKLIACPGGGEAEYEVPDEVTCIGEGAFYGNQTLTSVRISDSVTNIEWRAFCECERLTAVSISSELTHIDADAFLGSTNVTVITRKDDSPLRIRKLAALSLAPFGIALKYTISHVQENVSDFSPIITAMQDDVVYTARNDYVAGALNCDEGDHVLYWNMSQQDIPALTNATVALQYAGGTDMVTTSSVMKVRNINVAILRNGDTVVGGSNGHAVKMNYAGTTETPISVMIAGEKVVDAAVTNGAYSWDLAADGRNEISYTFENLAKWVMTVNVSLQTVPVDDGTDGQGGRESDFGYLGVYDGMAHTITVQVPSEVKEDCSIAYSLNQDGPYVKDLLFTNVCDQTVWYTVATPGYGTYTNYAYVTITKASLLEEPGEGEILADGLSKFDVTHPYDGEGRTIDVNELIAAFSTPINSFFETKFLYATEEMKAQNQWADIPPTFKEIGEHDIWYKVENPNYESFEHRVRITIRKRQITLTSDDANWVYDGNVHTNTAITIGGDGFMAGDVATFVVTGSQTNVGSSKNEFSYSLSDGTHADIYEISLAFGTLTVVASDCVRIASGVRKINAEALKNCTAVREIVLPSSVVSIGDDAFAGCTGLTNIVFPAAMELRWGQLRRVGLPDAVVRTVFANGDWITAGRFLLDYIGSRDVSELTIPKGIEIIEECVFDGLDNLQQIRFNGSEKEIGTRAFRNCTYLDDVVVPDSVTVIGEEAFSGCSFIYDFKMGSGVEEIKANAFAGCQSLEQMNFSRNLKVIGECAFTNCYYLRDVALPLGITNIASSAFVECPSLMGVTVPTHVAPLSKLFPEQYKSIRSVAISDGETSMVDSMFEGCQMLGADAEAGEDGIVLPSGLTNISYRAFADCESLVQLTVPTSIVSIGEAAFERCAFTAFEMPDSVMTVGIGAFRNCSHLKDITLAKNLQEIPDELFAGCAALDSFTVPGNVASLGANFVPYQTSAIYFMSNAPFCAATAYDSANAGELVNYVKRGTKAWNGQPTGRVLPAPAVWPKGTSVKIAYWTPNQFDAVFDANGGSFENPVAETYSCKETTFETYAIPPYDPVRPGYAFAGWWTDATSGSRIRATTRVTLTKPNDEVQTIYAHWRKEETRFVTIRFNANGGVVSPTTTNCVVGNVYGNALASVVPTKEHYEFHGWYTMSYWPDGELQTAASLVPDADRELFARWEAKTYAVRYLANGGDGEMANGSYTYGEKFNLASNRYTKAGCVFVGWSLKVDGAKKYDDQSLLVDFGTVQDGMIDLYAIWEQVGDFYSVRFDSNGGVGTMPNQTIEVGTTVALSQNLFTRSGYRFVGWALQTNDYATVFEDCATVRDLSKTAGDTVPLFAVWESATAGVVSAEITGGKAIAVDADWRDELDQRFGVGTHKKFLQLFGGDLAESLLMPTGKKSQDGSFMSVWHDYVAGTDPTDVASRFTSAIEMSNGVPVVTWSPNLNTNEAVRLYRVWGAATLDGSWAWPADAAKHRFFKVEVAMPDGATATDAPGPVVGGE